MMGVPGSKIGGMTGGIVDERIEIVRGNRPGGQKHVGGQPTTNEKSRAE